MTLVPYSPWLCLSCGRSQRTSDAPEACCPDRVLLRVLVDEPDPDPDLLPEAA